jgi:Rieske Fe-S protein
MAQENRRSFLRWVINGLSAIIAIILGVPAIAFLIDGRNRKVQASGFKRLARVSELTVDQPREFVIRATRWDGWNLYPNEVVGRVFLVLRKAVPETEHREEIKPENNPQEYVEAFTTICPHLGCSINYTGNRAEPFVCPCHGGRFNMLGQRILTGANNPAPRGMDSLPEKLIRVPGSPAREPDYFIEVKYQNFYTGEEEPIVRG